MNTLANLKNSVKNFHADEAGLQTLDTVMIVAIGAVALIFIIKFGKSLFQSVQFHVQRLVQ